jgi:hypothetical protein
MWFLYGIAVVLGIFAGVTLITSKIYGQSNTALATTTHAAISSTPLPATTTTPPVPPTRTSIPWGKYAKWSGYVLLGVLVLVFIMTLTPYISGVINWSASSWSVLSLTIYPWIKSLAEIPPLLILGTVLLISCLFVFGKKATAIRLMLAGVITTIIWTSIPESTKLQLIYQTSDYYPWRNQQTIILEGSQWSERIDGRPGYKFCIDTLSSKDKGHWFQDMYIIFN